MVITAAAGVAVAWSINLEKLFLELSLSALEVVARAVVVRRCGAAAVRILFLVVWLPLAGVLVGFIILLMECPAGLEGPAAGHLAAGVLVNHGWAARLLKLIQMAVLDTVTRGVTVTVYTAAAAGVAGLVRPGIMSHLLIPAGTAGMD
jgi:hypothetical protein